MITKVVYWGMSGIVYNEEEIKFDRFEDVNVINQGAGSLHILNKDGSLCKVYASGKWITVENLGVGAEE